MWYGSGMDNLSEVLAFLQKRRAAVRAELDEILTRYDAAIVSLAAKTNNKPLSLVTRPKRVVSEATRRKISLGIRKRLKEKKAAKAT